ncbi:MAG: GFA family protein [Hoeflea sp.]|nr:GFA family protein [Alphaproteobacteria bacterium]MBV1723119.1 GFA family protein [Hoeflea sp.]MBU4542615.1 GFA family protein [Alphaproteobacteria bacterium]MBU4551296.1 GFA family protein [Alphaproteobacteria bacterium]MBV1760130.1 GFA family protein [Hoeflea sp.]
MPLIASCHCDATRIELPHAPLDAHECNCSYCARTGAIWAYFKPGEMKILSEDKDKVYSVSGSLSRHHFCGHCGMQTWGDSPDWASMYNMDGTSKTGDPSAVPTARIHVVNLRLVDDLDWSSVTVEKVDGRNNW